MMNTVFLLFSGLGHFKDAATGTPLEGGLKDVTIKQVSSSADCCLALSGTCMLVMKYCVVTPCFDLNT